MMNNGLRIVTGYEECFQQKLRYILLFSICVILLLTGCNGTQGKKTTNMSLAESESMAASETVRQVSDSAKESAVESETHSDSVTISFDFTRCQTLASNQYAVWIEDSQGKLVRTLMATRFTANGGFKNREDSLSTWVAKAKPAGISSDEVDTISGATPQTGKMVYTWDGTDSSGEKVPDGTYQIYLEGTLYWSSRVLFSGSFTFGSGSSGDIEVTAVYTEDREENRDMIQNVKVEYTSSDRQDREESSDVTEQKRLGGMSPEDALEYMKATPDLVIVQVNTAKWKITPGFTGALWIPHDEMEERYDEIPTGRPVLLHCGGGIVSVPAYETLVKKRPDIPELSYIAGSPHSIIDEYNKWLETNAGK